MSFPLSVSVCALNYLAEFFVGLKMGGKREECNNEASKFLFLISCGSKHAHYLLQASYWNCEAESATFYILNKMKIKFKKSASYQSQG